MTTLPNLKARLRDTVQVRCGLCVGLEYTDFIRLLDALDSKDEVSEEYLRNLWHLLPLFGKPTISELRAALAAAKGVA